METQSGRRKRQATEDLHLEPSWDKKVVQAAAKTIAEACIAMRDRLPYGHLTKLLKSNPQYEQMGIQHHTVNNWVRAIDRVANDEETEELPVTPEDENSPQCNGSATTTTDPGPEHNKGGRPKGSTKRAKKEAESNLQKAIMAASVNLYRAKEQGEIPNGALTKIIKDAKDKHSVPEDVVISEHTIQSRAARGNLDGSTPSTMAPAESRLVVFSVAAIRAGVEVRRASFLKFANSIIRNTEVERQVIAYKQKHCGFQDIGSCCRVMNRVDRASKSSFNCVIRKSIM